MSQKHRRHQLKPRGQVMKARRCIIILANIKMRLGKHRVPPGEDPN